MTWKLAIVLLPALALALAGCGTPDEQESDENAQSEQESVGEGEIPSLGTIGLFAAVAAAAAIVGWKRARR